MCRSVEPKPPNWTANKKVAGLPTFIVRRRPADLKTDLGDVDLATTLSCPRTAGPPTWSTRRGKSVWRSYALDVELTRHSLIHVRKIDSTGSGYLRKSWSSVRASRNSDSLGRGVDQEGSKRRPEPARRSSSEDELPGASPIAKLASRDRSFDRDSEGPEWFLREEVRCSKKRPPCCRGKHPRGPRLDTSRLIDRDDVAIDMALGLA
ncbi:hypothetical protein GW17_00042363 [Ensete ventricosum]|nr:hypothetical protein GW17_00042363 [Ensete ventricosum]